jgi:ABC-type uncharacterized transport system substrate-binding protein
MKYAIKRLSLGLSLILLAAGVLLASDWNRRSGPKGAVPKVALFQFATRPLLEEGMQGIRESLAKAGFVPERNIHLQTFNAENDLPTANAISKAIVDGGFSMVVTVSTPCLQTMAQANREGKLIHVFGLVTDPFSSGVEINKQDPLDHPRHLVGVGSFQPVEETFRLAKQLYPELKAVGEVWNPGEACSEACTLLAREECAKLGITLLEANVDTSAAVKEAAESLIGRGAEALWIGGDNTVQIAAAPMIQIAERSRIPLFANNPSEADNGALFALGADYTEVGRITGNLAARILHGLDPASVPISNEMPEKLAINLQTLSKLRDPWKAPEAVLAKAAVVIREDGTKSEKKVETAETRSRPLAKKWRIRFIKLVEEATADGSQEGFLQGLREEGFQEGGDYEVEVSSAQGDMPTALNLIDDALTNQVDLLAVATTSVLQAVLQKVKEIPVVFTCVANPVLAGAGESDIHHLPNVTGVSTMSDFDGMVAVVKECLPGARRIGTLFGPAEVNSVFYRDGLKAASQRGGLELVSVPVSKSSEVADAALSLCGMGIDALCQVSDNINNVSFSGIAQAARKEKAPLFTFVSSHVEKEGAAVAVARDYEQAGRDTAALAARIMRGEDPAKIPFQVVSRTAILVNLENAALCGLTIPPSVLKRAQLVAAR